MNVSVSAATLKALILFFAVVGLTAGTVNAGAPRSPFSPKFVFGVTSLSPSIPAVADFNDMPLVFCPECPVLQPVAPKVASYDDSGMEIYTAWNLVSSLRPEVPSTADFSDEEVIPASDLHKLAPAVPSEAGYEDSL